MSGTAKRFKCFTVTLEPMGRRTGQLTVPLEASDETAARAIAKEQYSAYRVKKVLECKNAFYDDIAIKFDGRSGTMSMRIFAKPGASAETGYKSPLAMELTKAWLDGEDVENISEVDYPGLMDWSKTKTKGKCYWIVVRKNSDAAIHELVANRLEWELARAVKENTKAALEVYRGRSQSVVTRIKAQFKALGKSDLLEIGSAVRPR